VGPRRRARRSRVDDGSWSANRPRWASPPPGPGRRRTDRAVVMRWIALSLPVAIAGCCTIVEPPEPEEPPRRREADPTPRPGDVDLGVATYPPGERAARPARFRFRVPLLEPKYYRAAYVLSDAERHDVRTALTRYAESVGYRQSGSDRFTWTPPPGCG